MNTIFRNVSVTCTNILSGASKVSLSSISSQELWEQSGRLTEGSEVDRISLAFRGLGVNITSDISIRRSKRRSFHSCSDPRGRNHYSCWELDDILQESPFTSVPNKSEISSPVTDYPRLTPQKLGNTAMKLVRGRVFSGGENSS